MPDTQICRFCKRLWPATLLFAEDGRCPRCQVHPAADDTAAVRRSLGIGQELRNDEGTVVGVQWEWIPCPSTHPRADNVVCVFRLDHDGEHRCGDWSWNNESSKDGGKA